MLMYEHREPFSRQFDVIDLDPYGSPTKFLDSAVQAIRDGGITSLSYTNHFAIQDYHSITTLYHTSPFNACTINQLQGSRFMLMVKDTI